MVYHNLKGELAVRRSGRAPHRHTALIKGIRACKVRAPRPRRRRPR